MRKAIDGYIYEDGLISGSDKAMIEGEAKRMYPDKVTKVLKERDGYYHIWVRLGKVKKGVPIDPVSLLVEQFTRDSGVFRETAVIMKRELLPKKLTAGVRALQLLSEYGPDASVKAAWRKVFSKYSIKFLGTNFGVIGIAYTGRLTQADLRLIDEWASE